MATGGAPGLRDVRCLVGSLADETGPPLLHHLPTHPPDHLQRPEADLHPQTDHSTDPGATDHAHVAGTGRSKDLPNVWTSLYCPQAFLSLHSSVERTLL